MSAIPAIVRPRSRKRRRCGSQAGQGRLRRRGCTGRWRARIPRFRLSGGCEGEAGGVPRQPRPTERVDCPAAKKLAPMSAGHSECRIQIVCRTVVQECWRRRHPKHAFTPAMPLTLVSPCHEDHPGSPPIPPPPPCPMRPSRHTAQARLDRHRQGACRRI
jgi:hypothetical protein